MSDATVAALRAVTASLSALALAGAPAGAARGGDRRLDRIGAMEDLRSVLAAAQAAEVAALAAERAAAVEVEIATVPRPGVGARRRREESARRTVADVARARRISPHQASRFVAFARQLPADLPETHRLLATGRLSERRAGLVFQAVTPLASEQRRAVDTELAPDLPAWGDVQVGQRARAAVYRVDPKGACERAAYAADQRRVTVRPAPECMTWVTALLPLPLGVAVRAELEREVKAALAAGDTRTRGHVMADTLVERITGVRSAPDLPVTVHLVMTDHTLRGGDEPARTPDGEPVPAATARDLVLGRPGQSVAARAVRRMFTDPAGRLVTAETNARTFTEAQREFVKLRDGICATPWCDAPIRAIDHDDAHANGGPTSITNATGRCTWCNTTKGDRPDVTTSRPPSRSRPPGSPVEHQLRRHLQRRPRATFRHAERAVLVDLAGHRA